MDIQSRHMVTPTALIKFLKRSNFKFKKNHDEFNFVEPIFSFVSILSEMIKVPEEFSKYWQIIFSNPLMEGQYIELSLTINFQN